MASSDMIRLELPKITFTPYDDLGDLDTANAVSVECMANQLTLGGEAQADANSFCDPDGVGEPYVELAAGVSVDWLNLILDNTKTYMQAEIIFHRERPSPSTTNWIWKGNIYVPILQMVLNSAVRGYTRESVRFDSRGEAWQVDKGAGFVNVDGWTSPDA